jgi:hypothetical protein
VAVLTTASVASAQTLPFKHPQAAARQYQSFLAIYNTYRCVGSRYVLNCKSPLTSNPFGSTYTQRRLRKVSKTTVFEDYWFRKADRTVIVHYTNRYPISGLLIGVAHGNLKDW